MEHLTESEREALETLESLAGSLTEGETPEQKRLKELLDTTQDGELKEALEARLEEIQEASQVPLDEVVETLESLGYSHATVLRHGITKIRQQIKWRAKGRAERA